MNRNRSERRWGAGVALLGLFVVLMAVGVIPVEEGDLHAPNLILLLCGLAFAAGGLAILLPSDPRVKLSLVVIILASFLVIGVWVAVFGDAAHFSGGIPLLSRETNAVLARAAFGLGAVLILGMLVMALRQLLRAFAASRTPDSGTSPDDA